jgi:Xaa-Pro dipeptidase
MHRLAERIILTGLKEFGCLTGDVDEMMEKRLGFLFMPHGLGHLIGLDTHDVGGYLPSTPERSKLPGLKNLRTSRIIEEGVILTIEPGCYFVNFLLDGDVPKQFYEFDLSHVNREKVKEYQDEIQGVRIEDVVLITADGNENLSYDVPRSIEQIENCMAGKEWRNGYL